MTGDAPDDRASDDHASDDDDPLDEVSDDETESIPPAADDAEATDSDGDDDADPESNTTTAPDPLDVIPDDEPDAEADADAEPATDALSGEDGEPVPELEAGPDAGRDAGSDGPLGDMADELGRRRAERSADPEMDELFEAVDVGDVNSETLWKQVATDEPTVDPDETTKEVRTISKSTYCQRCEFFTDPPTVGCTNEGTTILRAANMEEFEVVGCPKVLEDERLENI